MLKAATARGDQETIAEATPPEIPQECEFAYLAFVALGGDRELGMGIGPIRWSAIDAYATRFGILHVDDFEFFSGLIRIMDRAYLDQINTKT